LTFAVGHSGRSGDVRIRSAHSSSPRPLGSGAQPSALPARPNAARGIHLRLSVMAITEANIISCDKVCAAALSTTETDVKRKS
jgi:hypothetical protein